MAAELTAATAADVIGGALVDGPAVVRDHTNPLTGERVQLRFDFEPGDWWDGQRVVPAAVWAERSREADWLGQVGKAIVRNEEYLALTTRTNAQVAGQVEFITRQLIALERLILRRFS